MKNQHTNDTKISYEDVINFMGSSYTTNTLFAELYKIAKAMPEDEINEYKMRVRNEIIS